LPENQGKAEAVRRGLVGAFSNNPDFVGYWDADLAAPLEEISRLRAGFETSPAPEAVLGVREQAPARRIVRTPLRGWLGRHLIHAVSWVVNLPTMDTQCGAKLFRVSPLTRAVFARPFRTRWLFDIEILLRYRASLDPPSWRNAIATCPLNEWREVPGSKLELRHCLAIFGEVCQILREARRLRPHASQVPPQPIVREARSC
jgi:hypothetical protein